MIGLSIVFALVPIPLFSMLVVPLVMAVAGFYYSYIFVLGSVYFDMLLGVNSSAAVLLNFLFKLSAVSGIPVFFLFVFCLGLVLPVATFTAVSAAYKPLRYVSRAILARRGLNCS